MEVCLSCSCNVEVKGKRRLLHSAGSLHLVDALPSLMLGLYVEEDVERVLPLQVYTPGKQHKQRDFPLPVGRPTETSQPPTNFESCSVLVRFYAAVPEIFHGLDDYLVYLKFSIALHL